ncbi:unnamed protein product, partial [Didymodactylos carnosus]
PSSNDSETEIVLKGVVRVENVPQPQQYIAELLNRVQKQYLLNTYRIADFANDEDFLEKLARKSGKLLRGGEPDIQTVSKMVLNDFQRGRLPHFVKPPGDDEKIDVPKTDTTNNDNIIVQQDFSDLEVSVKTAEDEIIDIDLTGDIAQSDAVSLNDDDDIVQEKEERESVPLSSKEQDSVPLS